MQGMRPTLCEKPSYEWTARHGLPDLYPAHSRQSCVGQEIGLETVDWLSPLAKDASARTGPGLRRAGVSRLSPAASRRMEVIRYLLGMTREKPD
jgi:hypothetical protein